MAKPTTASLINAILILVLTLINTISIWQGIVPKLYKLGIIGPIMIAFAISILTPLLFVITHIAKKGKKFLILITSVVTLYNAIQSSQGLISMGANFLVSVIIAAILIRVISVLMAKIFKVEHATLKI